MATLVPIICSQVASGSTIHTDEHRSYSNLSSFGYVHERITQKYNSVLNGVHTQHVESFNNVLKLEIKRRKGLEKKY